MSEILTQKEVNCFALYLSRDGWNITDIAALLDVSEAVATSKIYNAMELEGKINIKSPISCMLRDGKKLNYELDAEFYLGEAYNNLYYMNHTNIEEVANYIRSENDDDIPTEIVLSPNEGQNNLWRSKIYTYACNREGNKLAYERQCIKLKNIIASGIEGFDLWNVPDDRLAGLDFVQERINAGFKEIMDEYNKLTAEDSQIPAYFHDIRALAKGLLLIDENFSGEILDFSNIEVLKNHLSTARSRYSDNLYDYENWPEYRFYFNTSLANIISKMGKISSIPMLTRFEKEITQQGYHFYTIYKIFKKVSGIGVQGMSNIFWYRAYNPILKHETEQRRARLIGIRDDEAKKIMAMPVEEANVYLEEYYGKEAHLWEE